MFMRASLCGLLFATCVVAEPPEQTRYRIIGLFGPSREADLREAFALIPQVKFVGVNVGLADVMIESATPPEVSWLDAKLKAASNHTFGVTALSTPPPEGWTRIEIGIVGHVCKGCDLAAYEAIAKLEGVERATASFKEGRIVAYVDAKKIDRATLEAALRKQQVQLKAP